MPQPRLLQRRSRSRQRPSARLLCIAVLASSACAPDGREAPPPVSALGRAIGPGRPLEARLSFAPDHRACGNPDANAGGARICRALPRIGSRRHRALLRLAAEAGAEARQRSSASALWRLGLIELLGSVSTGKPADVSIELLREAALLAPDDAALLGDLAAAHLTRFEQTASPADLLHALDASLGALEADSTSPAALFNLALAQERLGLVLAARATWERSAALAGGSAWASEARERADRLPAGRFDEASHRTATSRRARAASGHDPQRHRELVMDSVLPLWGRLSVSGDTRGARRWLAVAESIAALAPDGGDGTAARMVAVAALARGADLDRLARLHAGYGAARELYMAGNFASARLAFDSLDTVARDADEPLRGWIRFYHGATLVYAADWAGAQARFDQALERNPAAEHPLLAGLIAWARGATADRRGHWDEAAARYAEALHFLQLAGEREQAGTVHLLISFTEHAIGKQDEALRSLHASMLHLGRARGSVWLHNLLMRSSTVAEQLGLLRAAVALNTDGIDAAAATGQPVYEAEALHQRARLLLQQGRSAEAAAELERARSAGRRVVAANSREWLRADRLSLMARSRLAESPELARAALDTAAEYFERIGNVILLAEVLTSRARAWELSGNVAAAERDLGRVAALVTEQQRRVSDAAQRAALRDAARAVFDALVALQLRSGRAHDALRTAELGRSLPVNGGAARAEAAAESVLRALPPQETAVVYAVLPDTIVIWAARHGRLGVQRVPLARARLRTVIERVRAAASRGASAVALSAEMDSLAQWLIAPVRDWLDGTTSLVLVPDSDLHGVPFAALPTADGYLVERFAIRVAPSLALAHAIARGTVPDANGPLQNDGVLLVSADAGAGGSLPPLPGAADEIARLRSIYPTAVVRSSSPSPAELSQLLRRAGLFHFAGHAVSDPREPGRSYLVLGSSQDARLSGEDVRRLPLHGLRLAVLSACRTIAASRARSGGFDAVAQSFLAAGAGGVLGTLWDVEDRAARELVVRFHQAYRSGQPPAVALRTAQLALLRSGQPELMTPAAWAAFRYTGQ